MIPFFPVGMIYLMYLTFIVSVKHDQAKHLHEQPKSPPEIVERAK